MSNSLYDDCEALPSYIKETKKPYGADAPDFAGCSEDCITAWAKETRVDAGMGRAVIDNYMSPYMRRSPSPSSSSSRLSGVVSEETTVTTIAAETDVSGTPSPPGSPAKDVKADWSARPPPHKSSPIVIPDGYKTSTTTIVSSSSASASSLPMLTTSFFPTANGTPRSSLPPLETLETVTEEVWENQRWMIKGGWKASSTLDRNPFSDKSGNNVRVKEGMQLPHLWVWVGDWQVDLSGHVLSPTNKETDRGWYYASAFTTSISHCKLKPGKMDLVRRRRWLRVRTRISEESLTNLVKLGNTGASYWADCERYGFPLPPADCEPPASHSWTAFQIHHNALHSWQSLLHISNPRTLFCDQIKLEGKPGDIKGKLRDLIRKHGVPSALRSKVWMVCSGASKKKMENEGYYKCVIEKNIEEFGLAVDEAGNIFDAAVVDPPQGSAAASKKRLASWTTELEKDLGRTFVEHPYFATPHCPGRQKLKRVLSALSYRNPLVNYCQAFNYICALFLLNCAEEDAFWLMVALLEDILPNDYYNAQLVGITVDLRVVEDYVDECCPAVSAHFKRHNIDISPVTAGWIMNLYVNIFPVEVTLKIWDVLFAEGPKIVFRVVVGVLKLWEKELLELTGLGDVVEFLSRSCKTLHDPTALLTEGFSVKLRKVKLVKMREKHRKDVMKEVDMRRHVSELEKADEERRALEARSGFYIGPVTRSV